MNIETAVRETLQKLRNQEKRTLKAVARFGKGVQDKARESFRKSIAESEAELQRVIEKREKAHRD
jgi:hypothetical protein